MKELLGLSIYEHGLRKLRMDEGIVYAALGNRRICLNPHSATQPSSRILEIGKTAGDRPIDRLLGHKVENVQRLHSFRIDYFSYVELWRARAGDPLDAVQVENVITRLFSIAAQAWPLGNKATVNRYLEIHEAHAVCSNRGYDKLFRTIGSLSDKAFCARLTGLRDIIRKWDNSLGAININPKAGAPVIGTRHFVPVTQPPATTTEPLALQITFNRSHATSQADVLLRVTSSVHRHQPGGRKKGFVPLSSKNKCTNPDINAPDETRLIAAINALP